MVVTSDLSGPTGKEIKIKWPIVEGTSLGTTKIDGRKYQMEAQGISHKGVLIKTNVLKRNRVML